MRIICISDTHNNIGKFEIPDGDLLLHAGDITLGFGPRDKDTLISKLEEALVVFAELPHKHKVLIAGNHDFLFQDYPDIAKEMVARHIDQGVIYLQDSSCALSIEGKDYKIYGSPWQPWFHNWAFNFPIGHTYHDKWDAIPDDTDILVTHSPPYGTLDGVPSRNDKHEFLWDNKGCKSLATRVAVVKPALHVFGHIHVSRGEACKDGTHYVNAAIVNSSYSPYNEPIVVDYL